MPLPRLNGIIRALESGQHAFTTFMPPDLEAAIALQASKYDGGVFEGGHNGGGVPPPLPPGPPPGLKGKPLYEPAGIRGDGPTQAVRYWGVTQQEYYERADVWPLAPQGEILVILMIEDTAGIANLPDMLKNVPGIGAILIGGGDLSQETGYPTH